MKIDIKKLDMVIANACLSVSELSNLSEVNTTTLSRTKGEAQDGV